MKFESIKPGMELLDIHKQRMGNTTMREWVLFKVYIVSVDHEKRTARVRWNGNQETTWDHPQLRSLRAKPTKAYLEQEERDRLRRISYKTG